MSLKIFAPNVHAGGGLVLLTAIINDWPEGVRFCAWLDIRAKGNLHLPALSEVTWVKPSIWSRLSAEIQLARRCSSADRALLFHSLPPLFQLRAKSFVFQQNRNFISDIDLAIFPLRVRLRLVGERVLARFFRRRVDVYFVQTRSMARLLKTWFKSEGVDVRVLPFVPSIEWSSVGRSTKKWDFLYVADGEAHKNHRNLIEGWSLLGQQGIFPSLALTLSPRDEQLRGWIEEQVSQYGLKVVDLGVMAHSDVLELYRQSGALIFPSINESFGLPLFEAKRAGVPILAGEVDFVRDICEPVECFDPNSPLSIARAVKRFLKVEEPPFRAANARSFLDVVRTAD